MDEKRITIPDTEITIPDAENTVSDAENTVPDDEHIGSKHIGCVKGIFVDCAEECL